LDPTRIPCLSTAASRISGGESITWADQGAAAPVILRKIAPIIEERPGALAEVDVAFVLDHDVARDSSDSGITGSYRPALMRRRFLTSPSPASTGDCRSQTAKIQTSTRKTSGRMDGGK
jgi:hypothetical protein